MKPAISSQVESDLVSAGPFTPTPTTKMRTPTALAALLILLALLATGCNSKKEVKSEDDRAAISEAVLKFTQNPQPREPSEHYQHIINTSKGQLIISSCEGKTDEDGNFAFVGPSRPSGYFLYPRMEWVSNPEEATKLLLLDYEAGNCAPLPKAEETKPPG
jgi:hypothetical protein